MKGPYRAALPDAPDAPSMFVLPGNHDWYDGLTSFLRVFAQGRSIGGWRTRQTRSYFAVQLPNRWWLVGLDTQFGSELDAPQLRYFTSFLTAELEPGDSVILCCATPTWVDTADEKHRDAFNSLHWFERNYIRTRHGESGEIEQTGASVRLWITGDSHHYARFAERWKGEDDTPDTAAQEAGAEPVLPPDAQRRQMVTCGLGGAYLSATHDLPEMLPLPPEKSRVLQKGEEPTRFARADTCYPDRDTSTRLSASARAALVAVLAARAQPRVRQHGRRRARRPAPRAEQPARPGRRPDAGRRGAGRHCRRDVHPVRPRHDHRHRGAAAAPGAAVPSFSRQQEEPPTQAAPPVQRRRRRPPAVAGRGGRAARAGGRRPVRAGIGLGGRARRGLRGGRRLGVRQRGVRAVRAARPARPGVRLADVGAGGRGLQGLRPDAPRRRRHAHPVSAGGGRGVPRLEAGHEPARDTAGSGDRGCRSRGCWRRRS